MIKILLVMLLSAQIWAGFNFGECSGSGTFQQEIEAYGGDYEKTVEVGEIPAGIKDLYIELISDKDVDIRLYGENDDKIVHWPYGILNEATEFTEMYHNIPFTYSGYYGVDKQRGHEFIKVDGTTPTALTMKAFGYIAGYATVNYSWTGKEGCTLQEEGASSFQQEIPNKGVALVGIIPAGVENLKVNLTSDSDLDIQLFAADGTAIVSWSPKGLLSGASKQSIEYHGMSITWSGYNGVDEQAGHEYITISNTTTEALTMKVYGYQAGFADVSYSWGAPQEDLAHKYGVARQGTTDRDYLYYKPAKNVLDHNSSTWSHTRNESTENWVQVNLNAPASISKIKILAGSRRFASRLNNAKVYLSDTPYNTVDDIDESDLIATLQGSTSDQWFEFNTPKLGQYIFIKAEDNNYLHISSIEAYGTIGNTDTGFDLAHKYGIASQGTVDSDYIYYKPAGYVLDHNDTSYNHTRNASTQNWVQVDLGALSNISKVKVKIGLLAHAYRLKNAKVYLSDLPYNHDNMNADDLIGTLENTPNDQWFTFDTHKQGRYLIVKQKSGNYLHIASIEAYGTIEIDKLEMDNSDLTLKYGIASQGTIDTDNISYKAAKNVLDHNISTWNHTSNDANENWVQINLGSVANISKLRINIGLTAFAYQLNHAKVYISDTPIESISELKESNMVAQLADSTNDQWFNLAHHRQGQYIIIKAEDSNFLHISRIEAYGRMLTNENQEDNVDIASKYGVATQGTTNTNYTYYRPARNILDHNASTYNHTTCTENENWVQVELPTVSRINKINVQIGNRQYASRLNNAKVYILDKAYRNGDILEDHNIVATLKTSSDEQWFTFNTPKQGQYALIKSKGDNCSHIAKLEVYGFLGNNTDTVSNIDLAYHYGTATQGTSPSFLYYHAPEDAIDHNDSTYNHTGNNNKENWLQVALDTDINIVKMRIKVGLDAWVGRLEGAKVYMLNSLYEPSDSLENETPIATLHGIREEQWFSFDHSIQGRYLVIKSKGSYLHIASVELYGTARQTPQFKPHKTHFLLGQATNISSEIVHLTANDYQGDAIVYSILNSVPFTIDQNGVIKTSEALIPNSTYTIEVKISDGIHAEYTTLEIKVTDSNAVENAMKSGSVENVTETELLDATIAEAENTDNTESIQTLLHHIKDKDYNFDWSVCHKPYHNDILGSKYEKCENVIGLKSEFEDGMEAIRDKIRTLDKAKTTLFPSNTHRLERLAVLLGDKYRESVRYPMDKESSGMTAFAKSYFADATIYNYRTLSPAQKDMGNFSRSDFSHISPTEKILNYKSRKYFGAAGVYAIPGKTVKVTRLDNSDLTVKIFVNTLRDAATHHYAKDGYNRPKYLKTVYYPILSGESIEFTSAQGGPIQISYNKNDLDVQLKFENIGEHPFWGSSADNESFARKLEEKEYDWAEISTQGFEVHSKIDKMITSVSDEKWGGTAEGLANAVVKYTSNYPHVLAGFKGKGIDVVPEIHDWANEYGITIEAVNFKKHMNADQAACGSGCSGNPYDAYWAFNPIGHGDIHELGHHLQAKRFEGFSNHAATNPYAYYTKSRYYQNTLEDGNCQALPFKSLYKILQSAANTDNVEQYLYDNLWNGAEFGEKLGERYIFKIGAYMHAQKMGKLINGWHVLARVHILQRESSRAKKNWEERKASIGFSTYTLDEYKNMRTNDWLAIAYSYAAEVDFTDYFDAMGLPYSQKARTQIESFGFEKTPKSYFVSTGTGYCNEDEHGILFDKPTVPIDGTTEYPY